MSLTQQLDEVFELMVHMADSKKDFLGFINYFYGERSDEYWDADFLVKSEDDLEKWMELYEGDPDEINKTNTYFRRWKIDQYIDYDNGLENFVDLWELDREDFIMTYYQQHGIERWIVEVKTALENGLTMEVLWKRHLENRYSRVEYLLEI